jgi:hypothetical protein
MVKTYRKGEEGFALTLTLLVSVLLIMLGLSAAMVSTTEIRIAANHRSGVQAFYIAEAGIEKGTADLGSLLSAGIIPTVGQLAQLSQNPPQFDNFIFTNYSIARDGEAIMQSITAGPYAGLVALIQPYMIQSEVRGPSGTQKEVEQTIEHQLIPIFQFGVFYDEDLEIIPGPSMTFEGRVHTNSDLYTATWATLTYNSKTTSAGHIYHRRKDSSEFPNGTVRFRDADGEYEEMTFDSTDPDWLEQSIETWGGQVEDQAHGIEALTLPIPYDVEFSDLVKRGEPSDPEELRDLMYYWKADLKIIDGVATDRDGNPVTLEPGIVTTATFYNFREAKWLTAAQIDMDLLQDYARDPENGIFYISMSETSPGAKDVVVRLVNGSSLPVQGLSVATDNPLYVWGDYNTNVKKPASLVCDAINILSNNWSDANSDQSISNRIATNTTVKSAIMTGTTGTTWGHYNGGLENLPRFLEYWSGRTFTYLGSLVCVWESQWATGQWYYGGNYYTAPNRAWSFDTDFLNPDKLPPGSPFVHNVQRLSWYGV